MESWSFDYVGKGLVSDESVSTADAIGRGKMGSIDWESKSPFIFGNNMVVSSNAMGNENQGFGEMCSPQIVGISLFSPVIYATRNAFSEENESSSKLSSSVVESNCGESGLFDRNLDRIVNQGGAHIFSSSKITNNLSSAEVSMPSKQTRIAGLDSPSPFCQVHGCKKSLISCKDYHKRHKVCEVHSKTAKVIVNGIEQRFCQQCSRFHLLSEFDDGKRSCRKRLADHNERRRKPHVGGHSGRHGRLLPSYNITRDAGGKFKWSTRVRATSSSMCRYIKLEDEMANDLRSMSSITDVQLHSESLSSCNFGQQYPSLHGDSNGWASNSVLCPFFNKDRTDDFITMDPTPMASDSRSALSLLSSQLQGASSCHSSGNPTSCSYPLMIPLNHNAHQASAVSNNMNPLLGSEYMNPENRVWSGDGSTIDLLQLSSELERVEHQKEIFRTKCANGASVGLSIP